MKGSGAQVLSLHGGVGLSRSYGAVNVKVSRHRIYDQFASLRRKSLAFPFGSFEGFTIYDEQAIVANPPLSALQSNRSFHPLF